MHFRVWQCIACGGLESCAGSLGPRVHSAWYGMGGVALVYVCVYLGLPFSHTPMPVSLAASLLPVVGLALSCRVGHTCIPTQLTCPPLPSHTHTHTSVPCLLF